MSDFEQFWTLYPRKTGKQAALRAWLKIKPDMFQVKAIMERLQTYIDVDWKETEIQFIPHASTWLNGRRWEDGISSIDNRDSGHSGAALPARPNFATGMPVFEEPTEEERAEGAKLLRSLLATLSDRLDARQRYQLKGRTRELSKRFPSK